MIVRESEAEGMTCFVASEDKNYRQIRKFHFLRAKQPTDEFNIPIQLSEKDFQSKLKYGEKTWNRQHKAGNKRKRGNVEGDIELDGADGDGENGKSGDHSTHSEHHGISTAQGYANEHPSVEGDYLEIARNICDMIDSLYRSAYNSGHNHALDTMLMKVNCARIFPEARGE